MTNCKNGLLQYSTTLHKLTHQHINQFRCDVYAFFKTNRREMPWRDNTSPYYVVVSELMLQQTQVERVRPKFVAFTHRFPDFATLAAAPQSEVLAMWVGLGYNRRALFLHKLAKQVITDYGGELPSSVEELVKLPGIGPNTAGAVAAYAFNAPVTFIETNIRSVMLHHFFVNETAVAEADIQAVTAAVLDQAQPRQWHWALMDYGAYIKKTYGNNISRARQYHKQSAFKGSLRQVRGQVIRYISEAPRSVAELERHIVDPRLTEVIAVLIAEKLITERDNRVQLAE